MLKQKLVPALLLVVPATAALSASTCIAQAVEECRLEPGLETPPGGKWNYRVNRDHLRCWFLSSGAVRGHHSHSTRAASVGKHHQDQRSATDLQKASPPGKTVIAVADESFAVPQATTPSIEQSSNLIPRSVPTIAYKVLSTTTVLGPTVGAARVAERTPASATNTNLVLLAGAAAALLVAGGTFHFRRQSQPKARRAWGFAALIGGLMLSTTAFGAGNSTPAHKSLSQGDAGRQHNGSTPPRPRER